MPDLVRNNSRTIFGGFESCRTRSAGPWRALKSYESLIVPVFTSRPPAVRVPDARADRLRLLATLGGGEHGGARVVVGHRRARARSTRQPSGRCRRSRKRN